MTRGKFIVFEGGEGSGKSSHIRLTQEFLQQRRVPTIVTHEPGGTKFGAHLRRLILESQEDNELSPLSFKTELLLFLADRAQHVAEVIEPALMRGDTVLCDRFTGSTLAYQIGGRKLPQAEVIKGMEAYVRNNVTPDMVIYLDLDPAVGIERKRQQPNHIMTSFDEFDLPFHRDVRTYFQQLARTQPDWQQLDADRPLTAVQYDVNQLIASFYEIAR